MVNKGVYGFLSSGGHCQWHLRLQIRHVNRDIYTISKSILSTNWIVHLLNSYRGAQVGVMVP